MSNQIQNLSESQGPHLKFTFEKDCDSGQKKFRSIELSDGTQVESDEFTEKLSEAFKCTSGSCDPEVAQRIISKLAWGMSSSDIEERVENVTTLLPALAPQDETEALLLGQFLALQDSGLSCLRKANYNEMFYHKKELFQLSMKLFKCANETMQTFLKYRSGGKQQIQVIHISGEGKAVIANEMHNGGV